MEYLDWLPFWLHCGSERSLKHSLSYPINFDPEIVRFNCYVLNSIGFKFVWFLMITWHLPFNEISHLLLRLQNVFQFNQLSNSSSFLKSYILLGSSEMLWIYITIVMFFFSLPWAHAIVTIKLFACLCMLSLLWFVLRTLHYEGIWKWDRMK